MQYRSWHERHGIIASFFPSHILLVKSQCRSVMHPNYFLTKNLVVNLFSSIISESGIEDLEPAFQDHFGRSWMMHIHFPTISMCGA